jgi:hypothetical protein
LKCLPILLVGCIFNSDGVVTFADFMVFFGLALALLWNIYMLRRGVGSEINFAMSSCSKATGVSVTTPIQSVL